MQQFKKRIRNPQHTHTHTLLCLVFMDCEIRFYLKWGQWSLVRMSDLKDCLQFMNIRRGKGTELHFFHVGCAHLIKHSQKSDLIHKHKHGLDRWRECALILFTAGASDPLPTHVSACAEYPSARYGAWYGFSRCPSDLSLHFSFFETVAASPFQGSFSQPVSTFW